MKIIQKKIIQLKILLVILCLMSGNIHALNQSSNFTFDLMYEQTDVSGLGSLITNPDRMLEQTKEPEYRTYVPGFGPPILVLTVFPGINSDSDIATVINCQTSIKSIFQSFIDTNCAKET